MRGEVDKEGATISSGTRDVVTLDPLHCLLQDQIGAILGVVGFVVELLFAKPNACMYVCTRRNTSDQQHNKSDAK